MAEVKKIGLYFQKLSWLSTWVGPKKNFESDPNPQKSSEGRIKNKIIGLYLHTINHPIQVFFKVSFLGFVHAPVMCISYFVLMESFESCSVLATSDWLEPKILNSKKIWILVMVKQMFEPRKTFGSQKRSWPKKLLGPKNFEVGPRVAKLNYLSLVLV